MESSGHEGQQDQVKMVELVPCPHKGFLMASKTPDEGFGF